MNFDPQKANFSWPLLCCRVDVNVPKLKKNARTNYASLPEYCCGLLRHIVQKSFLILKERGHVKTGNRVTVYHCFPPLLQSFHPVVVVVLAAAGAV